MFFFSSKSMAEPIYKAKKWFIRSYFDLQSQYELHHPTLLKKAHFTNIPMEKPYNNYYKIRPADSEKLFPSYQ